MTKVKLGIHLRQRKAEVWHSSLSLASVDGATNQAMSQEAAVIWAIGCW